MSSKRKNLSIAFVVPYPKGEAPSQRFRFEQYFGWLAKEGFRYKVFSFYSLVTWKVMYVKGNTLKKVWGVFISLIKRHFVVFSVLPYDFVFIHREAAPLGLPVLEFIIAKILRKKIIYDFDDAIWLTDEKARLSNIIRCFWKVKYICRWSYKVSCGNEYLANYARQFNKNVALNPTTIDTNHHKPVIVPQENLPIIGWTGSHSTLKYLTPIIEVLKSLEADFKLLVICNHDPNYTLANYEFVPWSEENEVSALNRIDIGIMPLPNDEWTLGKCGFKALQYMALKKPVVISPVGVNQDIVQDGQNGFLASSDKEWLEKIQLLIQSISIRTEIGEAGYQTLISKYSIEANKQNFLSLFL